jgi:hypothetical protein
MEVEEDGTFLSAVRGVALGALKANFELTDASKERPLDRRKLEASELGWIKKAVASLETQQNNPRAAQDEMIGGQKVSDLQTTAFQQGLVLALRVLRAGHSFDHTLMELNGATRLVNHFIQIEKDRRKLDELVWIMRGVLVGNSALIDARDGR